MSFLKNYLKHRITSRFYCISVKSKMIKKKILLIGPIPLPMGGVSIHVSRLADKINASDNFQSAILDPRKFLFRKTDGSRSNLFNAFLYFLDAEIVHIHSGGKYRLWLGRLFKSFGKKIIFTQHNSRENDLVFFNKLVDLSDATIIVCKMKGVESSNKLKIIPAYIPAINCTNADFKILSQIKNFSKVLLAFATHRKGSPGLFDGKDIYGFDILLSAFPKVFQLGMILVLIDVNGTMKKRYSETVLKLNQAGFPVLYIDRCVELIPLFEHIYVMIRPTRTDGDSISIREALNCGTRVIASDVTERPEGVLVYNAESVESLISLISTLDNHSIPKVPQNDYSDQILTIYDSFFSINS